MTCPAYTIARVSRLPDLTPADPTWSRAEVGRINHFHARSGMHRPVTRFRIVHDDQALAVLFEIDDRWVRSCCTQPNGPVCRDSCVEFFFTPRPDHGYLNLEINAGGTCHASHIRDPRRVPGGFADFSPLTPNQLAQLRICTSLPPVVDPEIADPLAWCAAAVIPLTLLETLWGPLGPLSGQTWHGNLYKCGDQTRYPHWAAWSPIGETLNFHAPDYFGRLILG